MKNTINGRSAKRIYLTTLIISLSALWSYIAGLKCDAPEAVSIAVSIIVSFTMATAIEVSFETRDAKARFNEYKRLKRKIEKEYHDNLMDYLHSQYYFAPKKRPQKRGEDLFFKGDLAEVMREQEPCNEKRKDSETLRGEEKNNQTDSKSIQNFNDLPEDERRAMFATEETIY